MKIGRFWKLLTVAGVFALGMVWQSSKFSDLSAKARELESEQENWIAQNRKIEAEIALLSSRERTSAMASRMGLKKALPEEKLRILLAPSSAGASGSPESAVNPVSSAKLPGGRSHD